MMVSTAVEILKQSKEKMITSPARASMDVLMFQHISMLHMWLKSTHLFFPCKNQLSFSELID